MRVHTELLDVLDRCLADVRAGRTTIERCLEENPAHRAELEVLLRAAVAIVASDAAPNPAAKLRGRFAIVEAMHAGAEARPSPILGALFGLRGRAAAVATALVLTITSSGVAVVAAQDAQPYEPLYPLKTAVEQRQLAFAGSPEARAQIRVQIAARRLAEADRAIEAGRDDAAVFAAAAYGEAMQQAYGDMDAAQGVGRGAVEAHEAAEDSLARLQDVTARATTSGNREAAAALAAAAAQAERERAERERPRPPSATPSRLSAPPAQPTPHLDVAQPEERPPVAVALADESESDVEDGPSVQEQAQLPAQAPAAAVVPPAPAAPALSRPPTAVPTPRAQGQGNAGAGSEQGGSSGGSNDRDERDDGDERGRGQTEAGSGSQPGARVEPTRPPTAPRVLPTPTLQQSGGQGQGQGQDQERGRDDNRDRVAPTRTATPGARPASAGDERARATATSTTRSGGNSNRPGNRDRDDDDDDRDRNRP